MILKHNFFGCGWMKCLLRSKPIFQCFSNRSLDIVLHIILSMAGRFWQFFKLHISTHFCAAFNHQYLVEKIAQVSYE